MYGYYIRHDYHRRDYYVPFYTRLLPCHGYYVTHGYYIDTVNLRLLRLLHRAYEGVWPQFQYESGSKPARQQVLQALYASQRRMN